IWWWRLLFSAVLFWPPASGVVVLWLFVFFCSGVNYGVMLIFRVFITGFGGVKVVVRVGGGVFSFYVFGYFFKI
ncbi:hypothetical protein ACQWB2_26525, partial [Salmonella enterica subsp. enterica serovar Infantis]